MYFRPLTQDWYRNASNPAGHVGHDRLRVFGIVDGDSDGLDIAAIVKFGVGGALGPEPLLMSPGAELIGVIYEDFQR